MPRRERRPARARRPASPSSPSPPAAPTRYVVVGLGGVGGLLVRLLVPFLHHEGAPGTLVLVDGDVFEERNRSRMWFERLGPKATVLVEELAERYADRLALLPEPRYLTPRLAGSLIGEGDVVFCAPDNHATRRLVERRCRRLRDVALFSGGNDGVEGDRTGTFGNVQIYLRRDGRDLTNPLSAYHPEIASPEDQLPSQQGCGVATQSAPQLLFTNAAVASAMLGAFYAWRRGELGYEEAYLDLLSGRHVPVQRKLRAGAARRARPKPARTQSGASRAALRPAR